MSLLLPTQPGQLRISLGKLGTTCYFFRGNPDDPASSPLLPLTLLECRVSMFHLIMAQQFMRLHQPAFRFRCEAEQR